MRGLGIVTGTGDLSEEIVDLASNLPDRYTRFTVQPWLPAPIAEFAARLIGQRGGVALPPFNFSLIARRFRDRQIENLLLIGDFPQEPQILNFLRQKIWTPTSPFADAVFARYFAATDSSLSNPMRYFVCLDRFLTDVGVTPVLASEVFDTLKLQAGTLSRRAPPQRLATQLPAIIAAVYHHLDLTAQERNRFAQAVIMEGILPIETEVSGTDNMIDKYRDRAVKRVMPALVKLPALKIRSALDQPTIGPNTVSRCVDAGVRGILVCAETTIVAKLDQTIRRIDDAEMFLYAVPLVDVQSALQTA